MKSLWRSGTKACRVGRGGLAAGPGAPERGGARGSEERCERAGGERKRQAPPIPPRPGPCRITAQLEGNVSESWAGLTARRERRGRRTCSRAAAHAPLGGSVVVTHKPAALRRRPAPPKLRLAVRSIARLSSRSRAGQSSAGLGRRKMPHFHKHLHKHLFRPPSLSPPRTAPHPSTRPSAPLLQVSPAGGPPGALPSAFHTQSQRVAGVANRADAGQEDFTPDGSRSDLARPPFAPITFLPWVARGGGERERTERGGGAR